MGRRKPITFETARGDDRWKIDVLTVDEVLALPPSAEMVYAARALGINRSRAYEQAAAGALRFGDEKVPVQRVGQVWRVKRADLLRVLGIVDPAQAPASSGSAA